MFTLCRKKERKKYLPVKGRLELDQYVKHLTETKLKNKKMEHIEHPTNDVVDNITASPSFLVLFRVMLV